MKKVLALTVSLIVLCMAFAAPASAATKSDILAELKGTFLSNHFEITDDNVSSPYISVMAENFIRDADITEEQADQIIIWIRECAAFVPVDKGPTGDAYTAEEQAYVTERVFWCAELLGYRPAIEQKANPIHPGDIVFRVYDSNGVLVFEYDGDPVKKTDVVAGTGSISAPSIYLYALPIAGTLLLLSAALFVFNKKRSRTRNLTVQG